MPRHLDVVSFFAERAVPGIEDATEGYARSIRLGDRATVIRVSGIPSTEADLVVDDASRDRAWKLCRRAFDLDADVAQIDAVLAADSSLQPQVRRWPSMRVPGAFDGPELAVRAVLGQQVSVKGARTLAGRLVGAYGDPAPVEWGTITHVWPRPQVLAEASFEGLGMPGPRRAALRAVCAAIADGSLDLSPGADPAETQDRLLSIRGVGRWTASYVCMRAVKDADAFLEGDLGVRKGAARLGLPTSPRALAKHAERWRPWRAYAVMRLWAAASSRET